MGAIPSFSLTPRVDMGFGRRIGFLGDSIVNGSTASNSNLSFTNQVLEMLGSASTAAISSGSVVSGHPGFRSDQIAPFLFSDILAANCDVLVLLQGTNDTAQGATIATFAANMLAQFKAAKARGLQLIVLTIPARGPNASPTAAQLQAIDACNLWLRLVVPQYGTLIDIHNVMTTKTTGYMTTAYDSGDGIHPNSAGHRFLASQIVAALRSPSLAAQRVVLVDGISTLNILTNPYFFTANTGWFEQPSGTGTAPTYSRITDTTAFIQTGNFLEMDFDGTSSGGIRTWASVIATASWSVGDKIAITAKIQLADTSGDWEAQGPSGAGNAFVKLQVVDGSGVTITGSPTPTSGDGYLASTGVYDFGPIWATFTVPAATAAMNFWMTVKVPTGSHYKVRIGEAGVINLTTSGLAAAPLSA